MPVHQDSSISSQESSRSQNENAEINCAYRLISQLRRSAAARSPAPEKANGAKVPERETYPVRGVRLVVAR